MSFQISNKAKNIATTADLYHPSKSSNSFVKIGGMALMLVAVNPMPAFAFHSSEESSQIESGRITISGPKVNLGQYCLVLPSRNDLRTKKNYEILYNSFNMHFKDGTGEADRYLPAFREIADSVKSLYIERAFVDVDKQKGLIDFSINLGNHLILTIGKCIQTDDRGSVMFTISYQGELEVADTLPLAELIKRVDCIQMELI